MSFDPKTTKYPYPLDTASHYLPVKKDDGTIFDENYPYIDKSKSFRFQCGITRLLLNTIIFPILTRVRLGLRIVGKENIKKNKDILSQGVVSVSNHIHMWDYISVMKAIRPFKPKLLVWNKNISGEMGSMVRHVGGIPIPENDVNASMAFIKAVREHIREGGWLHVYSEGAMWEYYYPIRPFKKGAAYFAIKEDKPIVPLGFSYRKPNWIRRKIFKQIALLTVSIGQPIYKDPSLSSTEQELDLTRRSHDAVCYLANIDPANNIYPPLYKDWTKRIDYYTDTYGEGYKGSL